MIVCAFFAVVAWGGVMFHGHPLFSYMVGTSGYSGYALVYLFVAFAIFAVPLMTVANTGYAKAVLPDESVLVKTIKVVLVIQAIQYLIYLPAVSKAIFASNIGYVRDDQYDTAELVQFQFYAFNILSRLYLGMRNVMIIVAFYALVFEKEPQGAYQDIFYLLGSIPDILFHSLCKPCGDDAGILVHGGAYSSAGRIHQRQDD